MAFDSATMRLISDVYDNAISPELWPDYFDRLGDLAGARGCMLIVQDNFDQAASASNICSRILPVAPEIYEKIGPVMAELAYREYRAMSGTSIGEIVRESELSLEAPEEFFVVRDAALATFNELAGTAHRAAVLLSDHGAWQDILTFQHTAEHGPMREEEVRACTPLLTHISKSIALARPYQILRRHYQAVLSVLDHLKMGVVVLAGS
jgi:hypothetical protein